MGLGNPGPDYQDTRHNAGFWLVDRWAGLLGLSFRKAWFRPFLFIQSRRDQDLLVLVKPTTYMNRSGVLFPALFSQFGGAVDDLLVVFDQMDLAPGRARMKPHGSSAGHNGLNSIDAALGSGQYRRLAIGVGRPASGVTVIDHVLGPPTDEERKRISATVDRVAVAANDLWPLGWEPLLHAVNQRDNLPS